MEIPFPPSSPSQKASEGWPISGPPSKRSTKSARQSSPPRPTTPKSGKGKRLGRPSGSRNRNRRDELLRRLRVDLKILEVQPQIAPLLKQCGILPSRVMEVLRADENGASQTLVALWDSLTPANQKILGLEALSVAAGLTPRRLWELYNGANLMQSRESIGAMIADALPAIMRVTINDAKKVKGFASREHIFKAARVLPTPKGSVINIGVPQQELSRGKDDEDFDDLEGADDFLMRASRAMTAKQLPAPAETEILDPEEEDDDE
jgi:hypothetical protein